MRDGSTHENVILKNLRIKPEQKPLVPTGHCEEWEQTTKQFHSFQEIASLLRSSLGEIAYETDAQYIEMSA